MAIEFSDNQNALFDSLKLRENKELSKPEMKEHGEALSTHAGAWKFLENIPVAGRLAGRHFRHKTAAWLKVKNREFLGTVGIDKKEMKSLTKQGFVPKTVLLYDMAGVREKQLVKAHHTVDFLKACKSKDHWVHALLNPEQSAKYSKMGSKHIKPDFAKFKDVEALINNWGDLDTYRKRCDSQGFQELVKSLKQPDGSPNMVLLDTYSAIYAKFQDGSPTEKVALSKHLFLTSEHTKQFLPEKLCKLPDPLTVASAEVHRDKMINARQTIQQFSERQAYVAIGRDQAFIGYAKVILSHRANTIDQAIAELPNLAKNFNLQERDAYLADLKSQYVPELTNPIERMLTTHETLKDGSIHYAGIAAVQEMEQPLAQLSSARDNFTKNGLESTFSQCLQQKLAGSDWQNLGEAANALSTLATELSQLDASLDKLGALQEKFNRHDLGEMFSQTLVTQVRDLGANPTAAGVDAITEKLDKLLNLTLLDRYVREGTEKYGPAIGRSIELEFKGKAEVQSGVKPYTEALGRIATLTAGLDAIRQGVAKDLSDEDFALFLEENHSNSRPLEAIPAHMTTVIAQTVNKKALSTFVESCEAKYGQAVSLQIKTLLEQDPKVAAGDTIYTDGSKMADVREGMSRLDALKEGKAGKNLSQEQFTAIINPYAKDQALRGQPPLIISVGNPATVQEIETMLRKTSTSTTALKDYTDLHGEAIGIYVQRYVQQYEPNIFNGLADYDESQFFNMENFDEQLALLTPFIQQAHPHISKERVIYLLTSSNLGSMSIEERLKEIHTIDQWTGNLVPSLKQGKKYSQKEQAEFSAKRQLAEHFTEAFGSRYLSREPGKSAQFDKDVRGLFSYASSLDKKDIYSADIIAASLLAFVESQDSVDPKNSNSSPNDVKIFNASKLPNSVSLTAIGTEATEKQLFTICLQETAKKSMKQACEQADKAYGDAEERFATLFVSQFSLNGKPVETLPKNPQQTLAYVNKLSTMGMQTFLETPLSPTQAVDQFSRAAGSFSQVVSFDPKAIDERLTKDPNVSKNLDTVLGDIKTIVTTFANKEVTYGSIIETAQNHVGPAATAFLRGTIEELLPPGKKGEVKRLDKALHVISEAIENSKFSTLDKILALIPEEKKDEVAMLRNGLDMGQLILNTMPVGTAVDPVAKDKLASLLHDHLEGEIVALNKLPDDVNLLVLEEYKQALVASVIVPGLFPLIAEARKYKQALDDKVIKELGEDAPPFVRLTIQVLPAVRKFLKQETAIRSVIKLASSKPGRFLIPTLAKPIINLFGKDVPKEYRDVITSSIPAALNIIDMLDLTNPDNQAHIDKYVAFLDVILESVHGEAEVTPKTLAIRLIETTRDVADDLVKSGDAAVAGVKAIGYLQFNEE